MQRVSFDVCETPKAGIITTASIALYISHFCTKSIENNTEALISDVG
jgi:hypothetical protein